MLSPPTPEDGAQAKALLQPDRLLLVTPDLCDLDPAMRQELSERLERVFFPREWASRLQSILLMLHEARAKDPAGFIHAVFLPWIRFRNDLLPNRQRIGREMARISTTPEGSTEETEHFVALYRLVVSDILDPYLTLFVACHQFIDGRFVNLDAANYGHGEFNKIEFVQAALRRRGDTADLFAGYNANVRNAISHAGSHGVVVEGRTVLFRDIKRGPQPAVTPVRWMVDELGWNGILMAELVNCIDAATEIFGLDCVCLDPEDVPTLLQVIDAAFTQAQRAEITAQLHAHVEKVWQDPHLADDRRRDVLAMILADNCQKRSMPLLGIELSAGPSAVLVMVPPEGTLGDDQALATRLVALTRYLIVARGVFGPHGDRIAVAEAEEATGRSRLMAIVPSALLDAYAAQTAGLLDLLQGGTFSLEGQRLEVEINEQALADLEDRSLGRVFPRRGRAPPAAS